MSSPGQHPTARQRHRSCQAEAPEYARVAPPRAVEELAAGLIGTPAHTEVLKDKPGRRRTARLTGPAGSVIAKTYATDRAALVADKVSTLQYGPTSPVIPRVRAVDDALRTVLLDDVPGRPLSAAIDDDLAFARIAGDAIAGWHRAWQGRSTGLRPHTVDREYRALVTQAARVGGRLGRAALAQAEGELTNWPTTTVVHRDLYEEQIVINDDSPAVAVGLIDLDDSAAGPAELDVGNVVAHLLLRERRGRSGPGTVGAFLVGYSQTLALDPELLARCTRLSLLRLACIHQDSTLLGVAGRVGADRASDLR